MRFIVIWSQAWMNSSGHGINYYSDHVSHLTLAHAISHGLKIRGTDDFNIGRVRGGRLEQLLWMHEGINSDPAFLENLAAEIGLRGAA